MKKRFYAIWSVLLVLVISIAVLVPGCNGDGARYDLTMAVAPPGSGTATDLTGASPYASGTAVNITATALGSYQFVKWTAPAGTFGNANLASTTFTMPAQNVTVTANFVEPLDHFLAYDVTAGLGYVGEVVSLKDQFVDITVQVEWSGEFFNPAAKNLSDSWPEILHPDYHLTSYGFNYTPTQYWSVQVENQFGQQWLEIWGPVSLAVPTQKLVPGGHQMPVGLDHFLVYLVLPPQPTPEIPVVVKDQFCPPEGEAVTVWSAVEFFVPVQKTVGSEVTPITNPLAHLVFYEITGAQVSYPEVQVADQFLAQNLTLGLPAEMLGVPTLKLDFHESQGQ
jgi:hypothetical protein